MHLSFHFIISWLGCARGAVSGSLPWLLPLMTALANRSGKYDKLSTRAASFDHQSSVNATYCFPCGGARVMAHIHTHPHTWTHTHLDLTAVAESVERRLSVWKVRHLRFCLLVVLHPRHISGHIRTGTDL